MRLFLGLLLINAVLVRSRGKTKADKRMATPKVAIVTQPVEPSPQEGDCPCTRTVCGGDKGPKGDKGEAGAPGLQGQPGNQGHRGLPGDKGAQGPTGLRGSRGADGKDGINGSNGAKGDRGDKGARGEKGDAGKEGGQGLQGLRGLKGERGTQGTPGPQGDRGVEGPKGKQGDQGTPGVQGYKGSNGATRNPGKAGARGFAGQPGAKGDTGAKGTRGLKGFQGAQGVQGATGDQGPPGPLGPKGSTGVPGTCDNQCSYLKAKIANLQRQIDELKQRPTARPYHRHTRHRTTRHRPTRRRPKTHSPSSLGSFQNPALSCKHIKDSNRRAVCGRYWVKTSTRARKSEVFCAMSDIAGCGGGGYTMVMKLDGHENTFRYSSSYWSNRAEYNPSQGRTGFDNHETKLATYWSTPFNFICLGMRSEKSLKFIRLHNRANSLSSLIADGRFRQTRAGRHAWKSLIPGSSLQNFCNREGFNVHVSFGRYSAVNARIGIAGNQEKDCLTPDSRIAFGGGGSLCGQDTGNTCGNEAKCAADRGDRHTKTFGYILVQ